MAIRPLVKVNGVALPEPSTYEGQTSTLVDSARNVKGYVVGSVIRNNVAKVSLTWRYLTAKQWADAIGPFNENFYSSVEFFDQTSASYVTRQMYVSDRKANMWRRHPETGEIMGFTDCSLALVEV